MTYEEAKKFIDRAEELEQDAPDGKDAKQASQSAGNDPVKDLESMRSDFKECVEALNESDWIPDQHLAAKMAKKWGLE